MNLQVRVSHSANSKLPGNVQAADVKAASASTAAMRAARRLHLDKKAEDDKKDSVQDAESATVEHAPVVAVADLSAAEVTNAAAVLETGADEKAENKAEGAAAAGSGNSALPWILGGAAGIGLIAAASQGGGNGKGNQGNGNGNGGPAPAPTPTPADTSKPVFNSAPTASVNENVSANSLVYKASATDNVGVKSYALAGADAAAFTMDATTGEVRIKTSPDFETKTSYTFDVTATDAAGNAATQTVRLNINDLDDAAPVFDSANAASVNENTLAGQVVLTAHATDNAGAVSYALTGADAASFSIDAATGEVKVLASPDFEAKPGYTFNVVATDAAGNAATQAVTLTVNDLDEVAPLFTSGVTAVVAENTAAGAVVYTAAATDNAGVVTYALTGADAASFSIDAATGEVKVLASPDFEAKPGYMFNVVATDAAGNAATQAVTLSVSDLDEVAPLFTSGVTGVVAENTAAGAVVYTAAATDNAGAVTYALTGADAAAFSIDAATGEVKLLASPDFETKSHYAFNVEATDAAGNASTRGVSLAVTDVREGKSVLAAGDIAIVGMFADNPDKIAFVALTDIAVGTVINFTDNGWLAAGGVRTGEGTWAWTATSVVLAGSVVSINNGSTTSLTTTSGTVVRSGSGDLAGGGDSVIAYQGTAAAPTFLYAVNDMGAHVWQADATNSNTSALPTGLVNGTTAVAVSDFDNTSYAGPLTGTKAELLALIGDYTRWTGDNTLPTTVPSEFTVVPDVVVPVAGTQADFTPNAGTSFGSSDASTAIAQSADWMVVGDDEHNVLRVYPRAGGDAVLEWNYGTALGLGTAELDLEAGTRIGDTLYFIGSHSNKKGGAEADNREFIFSVKMSGTGAGTVFTEAKAFGGLEAALVNWDNGNGHGLGAGHFGFAASSAGGVVPEAKNGFSIEGMTASLDGSKLYIGFRAPQADTAVRNKAVLVSIDNADAVIGSGAAPVFGQAIELDLGGRAIRSIERANDGSGYLIIAGPAAGQTAATDDFQLYTWDGVQSHAPVHLDTALDSVLDATGGSFESIVEVQSLATGTLVQLLQDNGDTVWSGQTQVSKDLAPADQHFLGNWFELGAAVTADVVAPTLVSATPADAAAAVHPDANIVLTFSETVVAGAGAFQVLDASRNVVEVIAANSSQVTISGSTVTLNPTASLGAGANYTVVADANAIVDTAGNAWVPNFNGSTTPAELDFSTAAVSNTTVLGAGDILFLGMNTDVTDAYAFVLMKAVVAGTQIGFTDRDYLTTTGMPATGESALMWTADVNFAAGTIITIAPDSVSGTVDKGTLLGKGGGLSTSAETVYAFQGSIAGLGAGTAGAITVDRMLGSINAGTAAGDLPADLAAANANQHITLDNGVYNGSLDRTDLSAFAARVKSAANWVESDSVAQPLNATGSMFTESVTLISAIQGSGDASPQSTTKRVLVEAMVTSVKPGMSGFFLQEETADSDGNAATSEGIFVYYGSSNLGLTEQSIGDIVRFYADVSEYKNLTELSFVYNFQVVRDGTVAELPAPVEIKLPVATAAGLEAVEGMLVHVTSGTTGGQLVVTDNYNLGRYGQVTLTSDALQLQFTETQAPNATDFAAYNAAVKLDQIILDDSLSSQNPATVWGRNGQPLSATNPLRAGDGVSGVVGVLDQFTDTAAGAHETSYRIQALNNADVVFTGAARPTAADAWAATGTTPEIKVVSANVLNLFTTLGTGSFTTPYGNTQSGRGANNATEYQRQLDKIVSELVALDADVYGLMEIQNNGFGDGTSAIDALVDAMNAKAGGTVFGYVHGPFNDGTPAGAPAVGDDAITTAIVYKLATVETVGMAAVPDATVYDAFGATYGNRPPMAQTFTAKADGEVFTVVVNHLKSKGSVNDPDIGDGQGANQVARERGATQLVDWLATHPTGHSDPDVLMIGDFNAYSKEDVIDYIDTHGFDKVSQGESYVFDGLWGSLDHAFASDSLVSQVTGAVKWANNAEESNLLDYNLESKPAVNSYFEADAYRSSDHNPILIGLNLDSALAALAPTTTLALQSAPMIQDTVGSELRAMSFDPTDLFRLDSTYTMPVL